MKTTVIVRLDTELNPPSWTATAQTALGIADKVTILGDRPMDAALAAAELMARYVVSAPEGGEVMAPPEVLELIPEHLRKVTGKPKKERF